MENNSKIGFFKRVKIAIFKLEEYGVFLGERLSKSFKYFFLLILLITLATVIADAYNFSKMINTGISYIKNELPDFSYNDGIVKFDNNVEAYDHDYDFKLYINTNDEVPKETLDLYKNDLNSVEMGIIILKDKFIYSVRNVPFENTYESINSMYNLNISNKQDFINTLDSIGINNFLVTYSLTTLITMYLINIITITMDLLLIAVFGCIAARLCGLKFKISPIFTLAIYSLTLSIVIKGIYDVVFLLTGFVIKYFNIMYLLIAYVYIVAAIFMIKYDLIKQTEELQKIIAVQEQVRKEANENEEESPDDKDEKEDNKKEEPPIEVPKEEENKEPDGSEI